MSSTRAGVRLNVAGALLRGGLDQSGIVDAQAAIRFALDVLSAAFDYQAGRFDDEEHEPTERADLLSEIVNDSDMCPGCLRLYLMPERRDPRTDAWAWRKCPSSDCKYNGRTVVYSRDWERRARALIAAAVTP